MDFVVETVCHQGQYGTMMKILSSFYFTCLLSLINSFNMANKRLQNTNQPMIENVLEKYSNIEGLQILALGSSFWKPPKEVFQHINIEETEVSKYGSILGLDSLRQLIRRRYEKKNLNMRDMDVVITAGANQGFTNIALALCDEGDTSIVLAPYYMCHVASLQLAGSRVVTCGFNKATFKPDWDELQKLISTNNPKMIVVTSPSNPSGAVWSFKEYQRMVNLCRDSGAWLVFDQTYEEFLFDNAKHEYPCGTKLGYNNIVHLFSFSKSYGIPGWRVGFSIAPTSLTDSFRKLQDTIPTCAPIVSQKLAEQCLVLEGRLLAEAIAESKDLSASSWVQSKIQGLVHIREAVWEAVAPMGTIRTNGAFYFLVPVPALISEDEAVDILATQFKVLLMPGRAFGADNYMRLSYGSLDPERSLPAVERLRLGCQHLLQLSRTRNGL